MIKVTRFNNKQFYVNADMIEFIESTPDTVITTTTGKKIVVLEPEEELIKKILEYKGKIFRLTREIAELNVGNITDMNKSEVWIEK